MTKKVESWGRAHSFDQDVKSIRVPSQIDEALSGATSDVSVLAHGMGRSYGDSNLNADGALANLTRLDNFIDADWDAGVIKAQAGVTLNDIL